MEKKKLGLRVGGLGMRRRRVYTRFVGFSWSFGGGGDHQNPRKKEGGTHIWVKKEGGAEYSLNLSQSGTSTANRRQQNSPAKEILWDKREKLPSV